MDRHHCPKRGGVEWRGLQQGPHYGKPYWHNRNGMRFLLFLNTSKKIGSHSLEYKLQCYVCTLSCMATVWSINLNIYDI